MQLSFQAAKSNPLYCELVPGHHTNFKGITLSACQLHPSTRETGVRGAKSCEPDKKISSSLLFLIILVEVFSVYSILLMFSITSSMVLPSSTSRDSHFDIVLLHTWLSGFRLFILGCFVLTFLTYNRYFHRQKFRP